MPKEIKTNNNKEQKGLAGAFSYGGGYVDIMSRIFDAFILGIMWIIASLPIITIGASTSALYYTTVRCIRKNRGDFVKDFVRSFLENLVEGTILWVAIVVLHIILLTGMNILYTYFDDIIGQYATLFFLVLYGIVAVLEIPFFFYIMAAMARYREPPGFLIKLAGFWIVRYFPTTIILTLVAAISLLLLWETHLIALLVLPTAVAFLNSLFLEGILHKHAPKTEDDEDEVYTFGDLIHKGMKKKSSGPVKGKKVKSKKTIK